MRNAILALLQDNPMNGYQLITAIAEKTDGLWTPGPGSVYPALGLLADEGLIEQVETDGRKGYALTPAGAAHCAEHAEALREPWAQVARPHEAMLDVRRELAQLGMALEQVAIAGDPEQMKAAQAVVDRARKDVYRILAGDR